LPEGAYAAVDLGAESGRVVLGRLQGGCVELEEVHRFENRPVRLPDGLRWNLLALFAESLRGLCKAAERTPLKGIGVDVDQAYLGDQVMTSALKKIDEAVFATIKSVQDDSYKGGTDQIFNVANGGAGFGKTNDVGAKYADKVDAIEAKIKSGEIKDIPTEVK